MLALQHFEVYVVYSDHNPLVFLHKLKDKNQRLLRWSLILQEYVLDIRHIKGKDNVIADYLKILSFARKFCKLSFSKGEGVMKSALCYRITKYRIKEVSRMLTHADLLRTLNGTF